MSLLLKERDYVHDGNGGIAAAQGSDELLGEVLFRLTARRGSFPFLPSLGSRMHLLRREKPSMRESLARQFAVETLGELGDVAVTGVSVGQNGEELWVTVDLLWQGTRLSAAVRLEE